MNIIGREKEQEILNDCIESNNSEFIVVYGRRRVGKTFLIKEYFNNTFSFYSTGVNSVSMHEQLGYFNESLMDYGSDERNEPKSWREAFARLKKLLMSDGVFRDPVSGKRIVFLDELPWMDTPRSNFRAALDHFWNSWASSQKDIVLIVCGSATSWIIDNILKSKGGFYNRITRQIHLMPFTLCECKKYFEVNGIHMTQTDMINSYMVFGGIPYYLGLLSRRMSLAQNIDTLIFEERGQLHYEYDMLFKSLFRHPDKHFAIIKILSKRRSGMTRSEIIESTKLGDGGPLSTALLELEQCGFIRKYKNYYKDKNNAYYQITDPFTLFCHTFTEKEKVSSWTKYIRTPSFNTWCGYAFEIVCMNHIAEIKNALGISGVDSMEYEWRSKTSKPGAQLDLLIDRMDNVINVCEIKYSAGEYEIDAEYAKSLQNKLDVFQMETKAKKALHLTMICANGLKRNRYSGIIINEIDGDKLFRGAQD